ncbi:alanine-2-oxoglutarate aminotransferase 2 [Striga asiatica]|uniref:Alanine-2-oxoglutarate aminotransferase 2 n=1 Tax=Striga asiatica TaxID=4170 RepID=A0A5A7QUE0_STRAF|nr:alanine-2-oxoglutarate aminotransferase 2 [Striga asiatica]
MKDRLIGLFPWPFVMLLLKLMVSFRMLSVDWRKPVKSIASFLKRCLPRVIKALAHVILVCNVVEHWVVCRVRLVDWEIELYDFFSHLSSSKVCNDRELMLTPLRRLLPTLLHRSGYFETMNIPPKLNVLSIKRMPSEVQFGYP